MARLSRSGRLVLWALPLLFLVLSLGMGAYPIAPREVLRILLQGLTGENYTGDAMAYSLLWTYRLPRTLAAMLVGLGLSVSGAVFQGLFKNPLASPYTLGVSNGAGFGAALGILLSLSTLGVQLTAILFGLLAVGVTFLLASKSRRSTVTLVLAGMLVGSLFSSLVSLIKFTADPFEKLPQIVYWLMGSLSGVSLQKILRILPIYVPALFILFLYRWQINVLSIGDTEAKSYGVDVARDRKIIILAASVLTALVVSISGIIGWVGIVIPHLARMLVGPDFRKLLPASASLGMSYLLLIDDFCRNFSALEIPLGVVTGLFGAPLFIYFIFTRKVNW